MGINEAFKQFGFRFRTERCYEIKRKCGKTVMGICEGKASYEPCSKCMHYIPGFSVERYNKDIKRERTNDDYPEYLPQYLGEPVEPKVMTNQEAADILKGIINNMVYPRGSGKTGMMLRRYEAYAKAIKLLENTPD